MKKTLRTLMMGMMALLGCTALTSCTNDDEPQVAQQEGQKGYVEFTLSRGADTRTTYAANDKDGIDVKWSADDKILAFYYDSENETVIVEQFGLVNGAGSTKATFAKSDSQLAEMSGELELRYIPGFDETNFQTQVFDFSEQSGLLKDMANYDYFTFSATLTKGKISNPKYEASMAVFHFKANDINFGVGDGNKDFVFGEGTNSISLGKNPIGPITVKNVSLTGGKLSKDLYVVVNAFPAPTTLTIGSQTFVLPTDIEAGKMYTFAQKDLKDVSAEVPLTIEALAAGTITIKNPLGLVISYQKNGGKMAIGTEGNTSDIGIPVVAGDKVQFFGNNPEYAKEAEEVEKEVVEVVEVGSKFVNTNINCSGASKVYGNIMSLISPDNYSTLTAFGDGTSYNFAALFMNNTGLTDASGLILPATTLTEYCYAAMFRGCSNFTTAPKLPAETLAKCCYEEMFRQCSSLNSVTCLATDNSAASCTAFWLAGVALKGTFTKAASMEAWETDSNTGIPTAWTVKNYGE